MSAADPRRPERLHAFFKQKVEADQTPPDYIGLLSMFFGVLGLTFKLKICAWLSVLCCMAAIANVKSSEMDLKQIMMSVMFAFMGLFMNYFGPTPKGQQ